MELITEKRWAILAIDERKPKNSWIVFIADHSSTTRSKLIDDFIQEQYGLHGLADIYPEYTNWGLWRRLSRQGYKYHWWHEDLHAECKRINISVMVD